MFFNKHLIDVVMHQMVSRGYNVFQIQIADLYIWDEFGNMVDELESELYCRVYGGLPCCPYCGENSCH